MSEVKISIKRLAELEDKEYKLNCLEAGGVDNWEGYSFSLESYFKEKEKEEQIDDCLEEIGEVLVGNIEEPAGSGAGFGIREEGMQQIKRLLKNLLKEKA